MTYIREIPLYNINISLRNEYWKLKRNLSCDHNIVYQVTVIIMLYIK